MIDLAPQRDPDSVLMTILVHALYEVMQGFSALDAYPRDSSNIRSAMREVGNPRATKQRIHEHEMFVRALRNFERESHFERERLQPQPL